MLPRFNFNFNIPKSDPPPGSVSIGGGPSGGAPPRPRQSDPDQSDYESQEEYDAWAGGGVPHYGVTKPQVESEEERKIRLGYSAKGGVSQSGGRVGQQGRKQMVTGSVSGTILAP